MFWRILSKIFLNKEAKELSTLLKDRKVRCKITEFGWAIEEEKTNKNMKEVK